MRDLRNTQCKGAHSFNGWHLPAALLHIPWYHPERQHKGAICAVLLVQRKLFEL